VRLLAPLLLALAGCAHDTAKVPVPVACVRSEDVPTRPPLVLDREMPRADRGARVIALRNYQDLADPYMADLERIAVACSRLKAIH
jgi:hypothetical protein